MKNLIALLIAALLLGSSGAVASSHSDQPPRGDNGGGSDERPNDKPRGNESEDSTNDTSADDSGAGNSSDQPQQTDRPRDGASDARPESDQAGRDAKPCSDADDRARCLNEYCDSPSDEYARDCQRWQEYQDQKQRQTDARTAFQACRSTADGTDGKRTCNRDFNAAVRNDDPVARAEREALIAAAKAAGKVGARVGLSGGAGAFDSGVDIEEFDIDVDVETDGALAGTEAADFRITVSAELPEGRTVVLDVDPALLSGPELVIRYFDVNDDGTETEVIIRQADDLPDALDPTDDGGQPEFWIVQDDNGLQLLVSVPHWSTHAVTVQGVGEFITSPSVLTGIIAGVVGTLLATTVLFWPRRQDDDATA